MKRVILLADGTWNRAPPRPGVDWTNVALLARALEPQGADGVEQTWFYQPGLGVTGWYDQVWRGYTGQGLERKLAEARAYLEHTLAPGDELWLFGLSRGGLIVRALSQWASGRRTPIRFVGVWDTVDALGLQVRGFVKWTRPRIEAAPILGPGVENAFQALALDETRAPFVPVVWRDQPRPDQRIEQAWFTGRHPDVCGGFGSRALADVSLAWMTERAREVGLGLAPIPLDPHPERPPSNGMSLINRALGKRARAPLVTNPATEYLHCSVRKRWEKLPDALQQRAEGRWLPAT